MYISPYDCIGNLRRRITEKEIVDAIKRLKKEKSHGTDLLINEYFIEFKDYLVQLY